MAPNQGRCLARLPSVMWLVLTDQPSGRLQPSLAVIKLVSGEENFHGHGRDNIPCMVVLIGSEAEPWWRAHGPGLLVDNYIASFHQ